MPLPNENIKLRSFGRRRGRSLRAGKQGLYDTLLPALQLSLDEVPTVFSDAEERWLEIGFGGGEHLAHMAETYPQVGMIGCEPYVNGIADLLKHVDEKKPNNIRIYTDDARDVIAALPEAFLAKVFILYPDPWPKARHHKRRLIQTPLLDSLARVMRPGAQLRMASDHAGYVTWILEHALAHPAFRWDAKRCDDWLKPWSDWIPTRYEQKGLAGKVPTYLTFTRL